MNLKRVTRGNNLRYAQSYFVEVLLPHLALQVENGPQPSQALPKDNTDRNVPSIPPVSRQTSKGDVSIVK